MSSADSDNPLYHIPAQPPPEGKTSDFVDPPSLAYGLITIEAIFTSLMLSTVCVRVFVRLKWTKIWGWSDCRCFHFTSVLKDFC